MSESMVERVARALKAYEAAVLLDTGAVNPSGKAYEEGRARAAIEAMREPTAEMKDAVESNFDIQCELDDCNAHDIPYRSWGLMINAALGKE